MATKGESPPAKIFRNLGVDTYTHTLSSPSDTPLQSHLVLLPHYFEKQVKENQNHTKQAAKNKMETQTQRFGERKVSELVSDNRRLVEVPYTATLAHTMNALVANQVLAVPVAAPPGHWIGAGGSMILETDKQTGAVRKHYIGMVTMLDLLAHIAGDDGNSGAGGGVDAFDARMGVPVSSVIGHCIESLSLWTFNPLTSILDCMEVFSKGIHRALVPLDSNMKNVAGVELVESASCYRMLTQMDLIRFLKARIDQSELKPIMSCTVGELGAVTETIFGVTNHAKVINAIKCMRAASLNAIPIIEASNSIKEDDKQLLNGKGKKLVGTFSATDLRGCRISQLESWLQTSVIEFTEKLSSSSVSGSDEVGASRELVSCFPESTLEEVVEKIVMKHVHRVWVVDDEGLLQGLVSLTDIVRVIRDFLVSTSS